MRLGLQTHHHSREVCHSIVNSRHSGNSLRLRAKDTISSLRVRLGVLGIAAAANLACSFGLEKYPKGQCRYMGYTWALKVGIWEPLWALSIYHIPTWTLWGRVRNSENLQPYRLWGDPSGNLGLGAP